MSMTEFDNSDILIRLPEVCAIIGLKRATVYKRIKAGDFPLPIKEGSAALWPRKEINTWIRRKIDAPRTAA